MCPMLKKRVLLDNYTFCSFIYKTSLDKGYASVQLLQSPMVLGIVIKKNFNLAKVGGRDARYFVRSNFYIKLYRKRISWTTP